MSLRKTLDKNFPLGSTELESVSTEGFSDVVKAVKTLIGKHPKKLDAAAVLESLQKNKEVTELRKNVKTFYGNPAWVNKQTLATQPISSSGIAPYISLDGKVGDNPFDNIKRGQKRLQQFFSEYGRTCSTSAQKVLATHNVLRRDFVKAYNAENDNGMDKAGKKALEEQKKNLEGLNKIPTLAKSYLGSVVIKSGLDSDGVPEFKTSDLNIPDKDDDIPPLTAEQIVELSTLAVQLVLGEFAGEGKFSDAAVKNVIDPDDDGDFEQIFEDETPYAGEYYGLLSYTRLNEVYNCEFTFMDKKSLLGAMFTWIERSIK